MPRQRSDGRKSSSDNRSDIQQPQVQQQSQQQPQPQQQSPNQKSSPSPKGRKLSQIQNEVQSITQQQKPAFSNQQDDQQPSKTEPQTQAPNRYTLYRQSLNIKWNMKEFDVNKAVEEFGRLDRYEELEDSQEEENAGKGEGKKGKKDEAEVKLRVYKSSKETTGLNKKTTYTVTCRDRTGQFEITRYYHEFVLLREKLLLRWPGCFIPPIPTKKFGNNPYELVLIRMRFLNNFLRCLCKNLELYNGIECQIFFKHDGDYATTNGKLVEQELQKLKAHSNSELLEKYKEVFANQVEDLTEEEQKIAITEIKDLETELKSWKIDISRFKDEIRSLIGAKDKYYQAMTRLSTVLLPEFESMVLDWINDDKFNKQPSSSITQQQGTSTDPTNANKQGYLLNTQEYGTALHDAALSVRNYNQALWIIYDIFKFELKETDAILQSIECYEFLVREMDYLNRNININVEQIESLDEKKTTLKIFMMGGSVEEKKARINRESEGFHERLAVVKELLNFVLNVLINSIDNFHNDRAEAYKKLLAKSSCEELVLIKKLMDFHLFQLETFRKKDLFGKRERVLQEEEIVEE